MPNYTVLGIASATVSAKVEADNPEEAIDKADLPSTGLCHQCAKDVEVGDVYEFAVLDATGDEVLAPESSNNATAANCARTAVMLLKMNKFSLALDALEVGLGLPRTNPQ